MVYVCVSQLSYVVVGGWNMSNPFRCPVCGRINIKDGNIRVGEGRAVRGRKAREKARLLELREEGLGDVIGKNV